MNATDIADSSCNLPNFDKTEFANSNFEIVTVAEKQTKDASDILDISFEHVEIKDEIVDIPFDEEAFALADLLADDTPNSYPQPIVKHVGDAEKTVQCPRCKGAVTMEEFRQHIDLCPPRKARKPEINSCDTNADFTFLNHIGLSKIPNIENSKQSSNELNSVDDNVVDEVTPYSTENVQNNSENTDFDTDNSDVENESFFYPSKDPLLKNVTFSCRFCSFTSDKKKSLQDHMRRHRGESKVYSCPYCDQKYFKQTLRIHIKYVHPGQIFKTLEDVDVPPDKTSQIELSRTEFRCPDCSFVLPFADTNYFNRVLRHKKSHQRHKSLEKCRFCDFESTRWCVYGHTRRCHPKDLATSGSYRKCNLCSFSTRLKQIFEKHQSAHANNTLIKECPNKCSYRSTPRALYQHILSCNSVLPITESTEVEKLPMQIASKIFRCKKCSYSTNLRSKFNIHIEKNHNSVTSKNKMKLTSENKMELKFACPKCDFLTTSCTKWNKHLIIHKKVIGSPMQSAQSTSSFMKCKVCSTIIRDKYLLRKHIARHRQRQKVKSKGELPHKKLSTSIRHKCIVCSIVKTTKAALKRHLKLHLGKDNHLLAPKDLFTKLKQEGRNGEWKCPWCSMRSTSGLRIFVLHMNTHLDWKPIMKCIYCKFESTKNSLKYHILQHHKNNNCENSKDVVMTKETKSPNLQCSQCTFATTLKSKMSAHIKKCHEESNDLATNTTKPLKTLLGCSKCSYTTYSPTTLKAHEAQDHVQNKVVKNIGAIKTYRCRDCSFTTYFQYTFNRHMFSHDSKPTRAHKRAVLS